MKDITCNGCSLLCDDVSVEIEDENITSLGLCRLGHAHLKSSVKYKDASAVSRKNSQEAVISTEEALAESTDFLLSADNPLLIGWTSSSNQAIQHGLSIASILGATFYSLANLGASQSMTHDLHKLKLDIDLEFVRNHGELIIYWGSNPTESLHRHPSRFAVLPQGENIPEGVESRTIGVVDVRRTETMKMASHRLIIEPGGDTQLLNIISAEISGVSSVKEGIFGIPAGEIIGFIKAFKKSDCTIIFYGTGLVNSGHAKDNLAALGNLITTLREEGKQAYAMPMFPETNVMGSVMVPNEITSLSKPIKYLKEDSEPIANPAALNKIASGEFDAALVVDDVLSLLPSGAAQQLARTPYIHIGKPETPTEQNAKVSFHTPDDVLLGETKMLRVDLTPFEFNRWTNLAGVSNKTEDHLKLILKQLKGEKDE